METVVRTSRAVRAAGSIIVAGMERASRPRDDESRRHSTASSPRLATCHVAAGVLAAAPCRAQDLEPRAYAASPAGAFFLVAGLSRSTGEVLTDPTLPVQNIDATIYGVPLAAGYTFGLFGRLALVTAAVPVSHAEVSGEVGEETRSVSRTGLVDMRAKFSINLTGNPAMGARAFIVSPRKVIVGTSLTVVAPTGQYRDTQLINLGAHRWAFKPELGVSVPKGRWDFDGYAGVWLFTDNDDFFPGGRDARRTRSWRSRATRATRSGRVCGWPSMPPGTTAALPGVDGSRPDRRVEQLADRRDAVAAAREIAVAQGGLQLGPRGAHRIQLQHPERGLAVAEAHEVLSPRRRAVALSAPPQSAPAAAGRASSRRPGRPSAPARRRTTRSARCWSRATRSAPR